jgi:hypothetical protein
MKREGRWWARQPAAAALLVASGCLGSSGSGGCSGSHNGALGQGEFTYVCPSPSDPSQPSPDANCGVNGSSSSATVPAVAVGASFQLAFNGASSAAPQPAVPSLAKSSPQGWAIMGPGWLGFIEWSGSDVLDFTHVAAEAIAALQFERAPPVSVGDHVAVAVDPLDADGSVLGGRIACAFTSSNANVVSVDSTGTRVAAIVARAAGDATIAASCMGAEAQLILHVSASSDAPAEDASAGGPDADDVGDAGAEEPEEEAPDMGPAPPVDASEAAALEAGGD